MDTVRTGQTTWREVKFQHPLLPPEAEEGSEQGEGRASNDVPASKLLGEESEAGFVC